MAAALIVVTVWQTGAAVSSVKVQPVTTAAPVITSSAPAVSQSSLHGFPLTLESPETLWIFTFHRWSWSLKMLEHTHTTVLRLFGFCLGQAGWAGTRRNITHSHSSWSSNIPICFLHLLRSMVSSLFNPRALQSFSTISVQVFFKNAGKVLEI